MSQHTEDPAADIAWMRRLAEESSAGPMRGAGILMAAGLIYGVASLTFWAEMSGRISFGLPIFGASWLIATLVFLLTLTVVLRRGKGSGVVTAANRGIGAVWSAVGWGIFALFTALAINDYRAGPTGDYGSFWLAPSVVMVFYGLGWAVTSTMLKSRPLRMLAIASFIAAPVMALLSGRAEQYLAYGAALLLLMALPGGLLMRQARA